MFEISITNKQKKSIKVLVLEILMSSKALSVIKIKNILTKNYNQKVSYQAIHKAVKEMCKEEVLVKMGKEYIISDDYITKLEGFVQQLKKSKKSVFNLFEKREIEKISFENLFELYEFLVNGLKLKYFTERYSENYFWTTHLLPLSGPVKPKKDVLYSWLKQSKNYALVNKNTFVDKIFSFYSKRKFDVKIKLGVKQDLGFELMIINNTVVQIYFPDVITKKIDSLYSNIKKTVSPEILEEFTDLSFIKTQINVVVLRNKSIADKYKEDILKHF
ncbi:hypothetical protein HQ529_02475 [Candidatus Woesearchaeota archaeon]|nr:hypothetical protein [Candidatus Woesearchaeota archaeon]